ncbi:TPA: hypothetical protein I9011_000840 [Clostridium perfringens]|nr:hypothetical protein [Clostridium perfringens]HAT4208544.1 hypothetical protein [Clostridium perfringens]
MMNLAGKIILGIIAISTTLFLSVYFMFEYLKVKSNSKKIGYLILSIGNMASLLFVINMF